MNEWMDEYNWNHVEAMEQVGIAATLLTRLWIQPSYFSESSLVPVSLSSQILLPSLV
jgi:hypothetical protein